MFPFAVGCVLLLFVARSCFEIESVLSQKPKQAMPLVSRFGFLLLALVFGRCFNLNIALLVLVFCRYEKPKRAIKGKRCPNGNQA